MYNTCTQPCSPVPEHFHHLGSSTAFSRHHPPRQPLTTPSLLSFAKDVPMPTAFGAQGMGWRNSHEAINLKGKQGQPVRAARGTCSSVWRGLVPS